MTYHFIGQALGLVFVVLLREGHKRYKKYKRNQQKKLYK